MLNKIYNYIQSKKFQKPIVIQFPVNDICNSRCQMCNIWEQKKGKEISPSELEKVLDNDLYTNVVAVGLNGGEPTLRKDLAQLAEILFKKLPNLKYLGLITNGYVVNDVKKRIDEIADVVALNNGYFEVMVSLDGVGGLHKKIRQRDNFFENTNKVLQYAKSHNKISGVKIGYTISKDNVYGLHDMLDFAIRENVYVKFRMAVSHERLYHDEKQNRIFNLSNDEKYHIATFLSYVKDNYETQLSQKYFYDSLINQLLFNTPRKASCDWQNRGVTLLSNGDLAYCATASPILGNTIQGDSSKELYFDKKDILEDIKKEKCDSCMHDYMGPVPLSLMVEEKLKSIGVIKALFSQSLKSRIFFFLYKRKFKGVFNQGVDQKSHNNIKSKILVCGWYGTETLGDQAILAGVSIALTKTLNNYSIDIVSLDKLVSERTKRDFEFLKDSHNYSIEESVLRLSNYDYLIFGGGPLMAINEMYSMYMLFKRAKEVNVKTIVAGCGVGPLGNKIINRYIKKLLISADEVIYRDKESMNRSRNLGVNVEKHYTSEDPSMTFLTDYFKTITEKEVSNKSKKLKILLALRDWPYKSYAYGIYNENDCLKINDSYKDKIKTLIDKISNKYDVEFLPIPMCINMHGGDDRFFYRELINEMPVKIKEKFNLDLLTRELKPQEYLKYYKEADFGITMRFHSVVFGLSSNLPMYAIDYTLGEGKVKGLLNKHTNLKGDCISKFEVDDVLLELESSLVNPKLDYGIDLSFTKKMKSLF